MTESLFVTRDGVQFFSDDFGGAREVRFAVLPAARLMLEPDEPRRLDVSTRSLPYVYIGFDDELPVCKCGHLEEEHSRGFFRNCEIDGCKWCEDFELDEHAWPYDEGGDRWREMMQKPCPSYDSNKPVEFKASGEVEAHCLFLIGGAETPHWCVPQLAWLANLPYSEHGTMVADVYQALIDSKLAGFIPYDNRLRAEREFPDRMKGVKRGKQKSCCRA